MKTLKNPKGLELKPCLNCVAIKANTDGYFSVYPHRFCPCPNHSGEKQEDNGKIVEFLCTERKMHKAPEKAENGSKDALKARIEARLKAIEAEP